MFHLHPKQGVAFSSTATEMTEILYSGAIALGADPTHGLGGNDNVTLPNSGDVTFYTDSTTNDTNYRVSGSGGNYNIVEGAGSEFITIMAAAAVTSLREVVWTQYPSPAMVTTTSLREVAAIRLQSMGTAITASR
jgi:hypothetical protein